MKKIMVAVEIFDDLKYCEDMENECNFLNVDTVKCNLFNTDTIGDGFDFPVKCDQCKEAYKK